MNIPRLVSASLAVAGVTILLGCSPLKTPVKHESNSARIVLGVQSNVPRKSFGWLSGPLPSITLQMVDPGSGEPQCAKDRVVTVRAEPKEIGSMAYFVFEVPAGAFRVNQPATEQGLRLPYLAPSGRTVYIGEYVFGATNADFELEMPSDIQIRFSRNLDAARQALGQIGATMTLAETAGNQVFGLPGPCLKSYGVESIVPTVLPNSSVGFESVAKAG